MELVSLLVPIAEDSKTKAVVYLISHYSSAIRNSVTKARIEVVYTHDEWELIPCIVYFDLGMNISVDQEIGYLSVFDQAVLHFVSVSLPSLDEGFVVRLFFCGS